MAQSHLDIPDQSGKVFVVTGGNSGIGFATASALVARQARVILACRNPDKGQAALAVIKSRQATADVVVEQLDLADLASVRSFSERLAAASTTVDVLINNAGIMMPELGRTADGFELQFGSNVLGPFALTGHLLPLLSKAQSPRVVTLTSIAHWVGSIDFGNLGAERRYRRFPAYAQSKLANLVFAHELQRRLCRADSTIRSIAAHPGVTSSELARHSRFVNFMMPFVAQTTEMGAMPSLMAAVSPDINGGELVGPGRLLMWGAPRKQRSSAASQDAAMGDRLWRTAQQLTGVRYL